MSDVEFLTATSDLARRIVEDNIQRWGTVRERADGLLVILRADGGIVPTTVLRERSGLSSGALGGALADLRNRRLAQRRGRRGWEASS